MKNVMYLILVLALASPVLADVAVTMDTDGVITCTPSGDAVVRGVSLSVSLSGDAEVTGCTNGNPSFNAFIDYYVTNGVPAALPGAGAHALAAPGVAGAAALPTVGGEVSICVGVLDDTEPYEQDGLTSAAVVLTLTVDYGTGIGTTVTLTEDALRGGIVGDDLGTVTVTGNDLGCQTCMGDLNGDGWISPNDISALVTALSPYGDDWYWIDSSSPDWNDCGDLNDDDWMSPNDISAIVTLIAPYGDDWYWVACP